MNEPMPGHKTSVVAGLYVLLAGAQAAGFVTEAEKVLVEQFLALCAGVTLALKARRIAKGA